MNPEQSKLLDDLAAFAIKFRRAGKTRRQFWTEFHEQSDYLESLVFADDADPDLRNRYFEILDSAHDGYGGPEEIMDDVME